MIKTKKKRKSNKNVDKSKEYMNTFDLNINYELSEHDSEDKNSGSRK